MKHSFSRIAGIAILLLAVTLVFSGCVSNAPSNQANGDTSLDQGQNLVADTTPVSGEQLADQLVGGTGTGDNDITAADLEDLQKDLDDLSSDVDDASLSDI